MNLSIQLLFLLAAAFCSKGIEESQEKDYDNLQIQIVVDQLEFHNLKNSEKEKQERKFQVEKNSSSRTLAAYYKKSQLMDRVGSFVKTSSVLSLTEHLPISDESKKLLVEFKECLVEYKGVGETKYPSIVALTAVYYEAIKEGNQKFIEILNPLFFYLFESFDLQETLKTISSFIDRTDAESLEQVTDSFSDLVLFVINSTINLGNSSSIKDLYSLKGLQKILLSKLHSVIQDEPDSYLAKANEFFSEKSSSKNTLESFLSKFSSYSPFHDTKESEDVSRSPSPELRDLARTRKQKNRYKDMVSSGSGSSLASPTLSPTDSPRKPSFDEDFLNKEL